MNVLIHSNHSNSVHISYSNIINIFVILYISIKYLIQYYNQNQIKHVNLTHAFKKYLKQINCFII